MSFDATRHWCKIARLSRQSATHELIRFLFFAQQVRKDVGLRSGNEDNVDVDSACMYTTISGCVTQERWLFQRDPGSLSDIGCSWKCGTDKAKSSYKGFDCQVLLEGLV